MSVSLNERPSIEYAVDDPEMLFGEIEIYLVPPFDVGHVIRISRELEKHGYHIQHSSGSFRYGCVISISMEEPTDLVGIIANTAGIRNARISDPMEETSEGINHRLSAHRQSRGTGVHRIVVSTEPRKEEIQQHVESLNQFNQQATVRDEEWSSAVDFPQEIDDLRLPPSAGSGDGWTRRIGLDIRRKALRR